MKTKHTLPFLLAAFAPLLLLAADDTPFDPYAFDDDPPAPAASPSETTTTTPAPDVPAAAPVATEIKRENLVTNSPFRMVRRRETLTTQVLEIRGFSGRGPDLEVSITNPATRECHWVKVRDPDAKWYVESADPIARTAVVRMNGIPISIEIVKANEAPLPIVAAAAPPRPPAPPPAGTTPQPFGNAFNRDGGGGGRNFPPAADEDRGGGRGGNRGVGGGGGGGRFRDRGNSSTQSTSSGSSDTPRSRRNRG